MTGLLKLVHGLQCGEAAPNAQLRLLNPHVGETVRGAACALQVQLTAAMGEAGGGVSSFGYSGTIVHALVGFRDGTSVADLAFFPGGFGGRWRAA
jgi:acyl transferase domain-containing protein